MIRGFRCRKCGLCCMETQMPLSVDDIRRIASLGFPVEYFVEVGDDGIPRLRNVDGHCIFLDPATKLCKIYPYRPEGCRLYPLIYVEGVGVTVDNLCPYADEVPPEEIARLAPRVEALIRKIYGAEALR